MFWKGADVPVEILGYCEARPEEWPLRSIYDAGQHDLLTLDADAMRLVPLERAVSAKEEEDALVALLHLSRLPNVGTIKQHMVDAHSLFIDGKHHPSCALTPPSFLS